MKHFTLILAALCGTLQAATNDTTSILDRLVHDDAAVRESALQDWERLTGRASAPGAEKDRKALVHDLTERCASASESTQITILRRLALLADEESVPSISPLLDHTSFAVRDQARQTLELIPGKASFNALKASLGKTQDPRQAAGFLDSIARRQDPGAAKLIESYLDHRDSIVSEHALKALSTMGHRDALRILQSRLASTPADRTSHIEHALLTAAERAADRDPKSAAIAYRALRSSAETSTRLAALAGLLDVGGLRADQQMPLAMAARNREELAILVGYLERTPDRKAGRLLATSLGTLDEDLQRAALRALAASEDPTLSEWVTPLLESTNRSVLISAVQALAQLGGAQSVEPLLRAAETCPKEVLESLTELDAKGVDEALLERVDSTQRLRALALEGLIARNPKTLSTRIDGWLNDADEKVAVLAWQFSGSRAEPAVLDRLIEKGRGLSSRAQADAAVSAWSAIAGRTADAEAARLRIAGAIPEQPVEVQKAWLAATTRMASEGGPIPSTFTTVARTLMTRDATAPAAAHLLLTYAPRWLLADPEAANAALLAIESSSLPADLKKRAADLTGLVDGWLLDGLCAGPFQGKDLVGTAFPPERDEASVNWSHLPADHRTGAEGKVLDLARSFPGSHRVAYLRFAFRSPEEGPRILELGSDDGVVVWVNGKEVHRKDLVRPCVPGEDRVEITVGKGWNTVLVKVIQREGHFQFAGRITRPSPTP